MDTSKLFLYAVVAALLIGGCGGKPVAPAENKVYLTLDLEQPGPLRYKFTSSREIEVLFQDPTATKQEKPSEYNESLETVISYKPIKVNPYGLSEIEATIESISGASAGGQKEATENLKGKTFKIIVGPTGRIEDRKELLDILKQAAKTAFRPKQGSDTIKEPDLISDFMASQMFLWDSISSIKEPQKGIAIGDTWQSKLSIPAPTPELFNMARDVNYKLESISDTNDGRIAVITSKFSPSNALLDNWFVPYEEGRFNLAGPFGLYVGCQVASLDGSGEELFNIDQGIDLSYNQNYKMVVNATLSLIPVKIRITINQNLSMQLLGNSKK